MMRRRFEHAAGAEAGSVPTDDNQLLKVTRLPSLPHAEVVHAGALGLLMHGSVQALSVGQLTIPLLPFPVTRAWASYRRGHLIAAGLWLGPVIALKPPLALAALLLPARTWIVAGLLSLSVLVATVPFTGIDPWLAWLKAESTIFWLAHPSNVSAWGMASRSTDSKTLADIPPLLIALVLIFGAAFAIRMLRQKNRDVRMLGTVLWSILLSPLGWVHHLVLLFGPISAVWSRSWPAWAAYLVLLLPFGGGVHVGSILGSLHVLAALLLWASILRTLPPAQLGSDPDRSRALVTRDAAR
jgi:hypothetical protein